MPLKPDFATWASEDLGTAWQQWGCLLLRQAVPVSLLQPFWQRAQQGYRQADALYATGTLPESFYASLFRFGHIAPPALPSDLGPPLSLSRLVLFTSLKAVLHTLLGPAVSVLKYSTFRRQTTVGGNPPVPFHQDAMFLGQQAGLNLWMPLTPCGETHPGLEVVACPVDTLWESDFVQAGGSPALEMGYDALAIAPQRLEEVFSAEDFWHPVMQPGDVLIFHNLTLHRTYLHPAMTHPRISLEVRCISTEVAKETDHPLEHIQC